jgi:hypothetical protein
MKIVLKKSGETIDAPLRVAERYMRLGLAKLYVAPAFVFNEQKKEPEVKEALVKIQKKKKTKTIDDSSYTEQTY